VSEIRFRAAGVLGLGLLGGLFTTTRASRSGQERYRALHRAGQRVVFVFWHQQLLPLVHYHRGEGIVVLVSEHGDGEYITRVILRHGFGVARGSSTRGGSQGLRQLVRAAREGHDLAITPDGPRGPARVFKPGALVAARLTGLPVVPLAVAASSAWHVNSWDRFMVPRPLARLHIAYGEPIEVPRGADEADVEALAERVQARLEGLEAEAHAALGRGRA
jgi:lysophospholipid acyltransferase (LPLAT)-like uncharacterized protein